uniref:Uncharacterized protein n=1 Tax=Rhizophora mucronata TaxID=61149 RepID=A0A2P2MJS5_RHIMU
MKKKNKEKESKEIPNLRNLERGK